MISPSDILRDEDRARRAAENPAGEDVLALGASILQGLEAGGDDARAHAWAWLDFVRRGGVPSRLAATPALRDEAWRLILALIDRSQYTLWRMFEQRVAAYGPRPFIVAPGRSGVRRISWTETAARVEGFARGFLALTGRHGDLPVAFLSENRIDMALADLACLTSGIVDVMVPANAGDEEAGDVLGRVGPGIVVVSGQTLVRRIERLRPLLPMLHTVVDLDEAHGSGGVLGVNDLFERGATLPAADLLRARDTAALDRVATVMFTSGTTGRPKGIQFTLRNIVSKRFARGLALPEIGDRDSFLCYLPLCHTFGRYLEFLGSLYWGATYGAMADPSVESLLDGFAAVRPTVFISIPRRWTQLQEEVARRIDMERATDDEVGAIVREVVGERLRWGLSAAGYLPADTFRFFQKHGVELMSGFGMTEATGGITMTPPGEYRDDSLGTPLPGIELRLEEDGELSVRGPYVMVGYYKEAASGLDRDGWLRTGDLFERDREGHYRLVDRKKEIYKNSKGQTVAPQRVENLFRDFTAVKRVFLVGDHREYNTVLIVPEAGFAAAQAALPVEEQRDAFRTIIASVNRFLSPFERIVDFAILARDFTADKDELTPKGTYRRPQIAANFADVIELMYRRTRLRLAEDGPALVFPNWLFQALAITAGDIALDGDRLRVLPTGASLAVRVASSGSKQWDVQVGAGLYRVSGGGLDLGLFLTCPALWLGNDELVDFAALEPAVRVRRQRCPAEIVPLGRIVPYAGKPADAVKLAGALGPAPLKIEQLDLAARAAGSADERLAQLGMSVMRRAVTAHEDLPPELARSALRNAAGAPLVTTRRDALELLWAVERDEVSAATLERFLAGPPDLLADGKIVAALAGSNFPEPKLDALVRVATRAAREPDQPVAQHLAGLAGWLGLHGSAHPGRYQRIRWALAYIEAHAADDAAAREAAGAARRAMVDAFREWLGKPQGLALDPDTRQEYTWDDVIVADPRVPAEDLERLRRVIRSTSMLREAVFLLSGGVTVRLHDIRPGGVKISPAGAYHGRALYRVALDTRYYGHFDVAVALNRTLRGPELDREILWLIAAGEIGRGTRLLPEFGGYWPDEALWTEEFVSGQTAGQLAERLGTADVAQNTTRLSDLWPFLVWTAAEAYLEFWNRTARRLLVARPSPSRVVVPTHDYQIGPRLIATSPRNFYEGPGQLIDLLERRLVIPLCLKYPQLDQARALPLLCSALVEVVGTEDGLSMLDAAAAADPVRAPALRAFVNDVREHGFVPRRLYFAIERYRRWAALAPDATREAKAFTIRQLKDTYELMRIYGQYPESRARFFRETVLHAADGPLGEGLDALVDGLRRREFPPDDLPERLDALREHAAAGSDEEYFLVRLTWPHVAPGDAAGFISHERGGVKQSEVVQNYDDATGRPFRVRRPMSPREVGDLHRLFLAAHLPVSFRPDHQFLVALDASDKLIGGVYYELDPNGGSAHLEKIVVGESYRQMGVSQALMHEFLSRLRAGGVRLVTTGFFRPEYFHHFGFKIDRAYGGQVKLLDQDVRTAV